MCAIWLYLLKKDNKFKNFNELFNKFNNLTGRGPDNFSYNMIKDKCIIGFHRLAIMDLSNKYWHK